MPLRRVPIAEVGAVRTPDSNSRRREESQTEPAISTDNRVEVSHESLAAYDKPVVAVVGPYNAGKTFLLSWLLRNDLLKSHIEPTTSCITVLRHATDRPDFLRPEFNVITLRQETIDILSLRKSDVAKQATYEELPGLTTYLGSEGADVVVVFIQSEILEKAILLDCPGTGLFSERGVVENSNCDPSKGMDEKALVREQALQRRALMECDACVMLSSVTGQCGMFADTNTANVLAEWAAKPARFPLKSPHSNILLVGSQANPREIESVETIVRVLVRQVRSQWECLPKSLRAQIDPDALSRRILCFYALDRLERAQLLISCRGIAKREAPGESEIEIERRGAAYFANMIELRENVSTLRAAIEEMISELSEPVKVRRAKKVKVSYGYSVETDPFAPFRPSKE